MTTAVVVGSGPNGLTAAAVLARAGMDVTVLEAEAEIGGGTSSFEMGGALFDSCSTVQPLAPVSPAFEAAGLDVAWACAELDLAHPLPGGARTLADLPECGPDVAAAFFAPVPELAHHPVDAMRWGPRFVLPAAVTATALGPRRGAVFAGIAAHGIAPLNLPMTSAIAYLLGGVRPWTVPVGGSRRIAESLASEVAANGGSVRTGERVTTMPDADVVLFDTGLPAALRILGDRAPRALRRRRWRNGPGVFKVDLLLEGGVPWNEPDCGRAVFVHVGGSAPEIRRRLGSVAAGRMPDRPFLLLSQQYLADPSRRAGDRVPVSMYCHVPHGFPGDVTELILRELDRYAPGVRDRIVEQRSTGPLELEARNANYIGGDIAAGAAVPSQLLRRPTLWHPYRLTDRAWLCSAASAPGPGVHGMPGWHAAKAALRCL
ncbi:NAD(P)/FAD-dependent oxidoreductase [Tsukamurella sp. 8F]|uniref:phytoene desaturase family protein n=1 Tax=unclassified Tsukamurella TaxID=2633480 RepID=UPI0023B97F2B|nr:MULTISPECIES: NAD(P)/FAD-dependent oxidoreductase [unclassified Tsukamurella]MDF0528498.1 NAD(P)/FAD-dependent oxidoreductase [Tsukamurella sp. 8J]MDF0586324.1 NAD(P)/FAD-dependent oxidoreductase [Tsukamurella sp. 8F]